jgi:hypothetical protein
MDIDLDTLRERLNAIPQGFTQKSWWEYIVRGTKTEDDPDGVPFGTIKKIANGETDDPRISTCAALTRFLDDELEAA